MYFKNYSDKRRPRSLCVFVVISWLTVADLVDDPVFPIDFSKVEEKHSQRRTAMKVGVVYARNSQKSAQEMFANEASQAYNNFVDFLGTSYDLTNEWTKYRGDMRCPATICYYEWPTQAVGNVGVYKRLSERFSWNFAFSIVNVLLETVFHIAPRLTAEEHRRLLGNDIVMVFFLEEGAVFNVEGLDTFGEVPQVYIIVQPEKTKFRFVFEIYEFAN